MPIGTVCARLEFSITPKSGTLRRRKPCHWPMTTTHPPLQPCAAFPELLPRAAHLAQTAQQFHTRGWMLGTSGSLSLRLHADPLRMLITVSGKDKGALVAEDFLSIEDDGQIFSTLADPKQSSESFYQGVARPSGETLVHEAIYRRVEALRPGGAGAVYHVHTVDNTLCSQLVSPGETLLFQGLEMLKGIGQWTPGTSVEVPVVYNFPDIPELSRAVAQALCPKVPGVLVQGHGIYVWGPDPMRAKRHTEIFEFLFAWEIKRRMLGLPTPPHHPSPTPLG